MNRHERVASDLVDWRNVMKWGLIGGGLGSQIGGAHRIAAGMDGQFDLVAAALDADPDRGREFARTLGVVPGRAYGHWQEMLEMEAAKHGADRLDLVTVATPNVTHYEITKAYLEAGFNVLCEKPLSMTIEEAEDLRAIAARSGKTGAVNFGYSGYPMAIQAREMIRHGDLGEIRVVVAEFALGAHAGGDDENNPRIRWRYDPAQAGISSVVNDLGSHAFHMAQFMTGQMIESVAAQFDHCVSTRKLEDDAYVACRLSGGAVGRFWLSAVASGQQHGFNIRIFGSKGAIRWEQEHPNQLHFAPVNGATQLFERGAEYLYPAAIDASRVAIGHAEGFLEAFGNIYKAIHAELAGLGQSDSALSFPKISEGADLMQVIFASAKSAAEGGIWVPVKGNGAT